MWVCQSIGFCFGYSPKVHPVYTRTIDLSSENKQSFLLDTINSTLVTENGKQCAAYYTCKKSTRSLESKTTNTLNPNEEGREREITAEVHSGSTNASATTIRRTSNTSGGSRGSNHCHTPHSKPNSRNPSHRENWSGSEEEVVQNGSSPTSRIPSVEWTHLETSLDFWRQQHTKTVARTREEDSPTCKVRYNDTGSLEEVNVGHFVDYFEDSPNETSGTINVDVMRKQYKKLWRLRATLEEDESKPGVEVSGTPQSHSSADQSPETCDHPGSHTTSFESNTEPLLDDHMGPSKWMPHATPLSTYESRRQTYRNVLSWRLRRMEARKHNGVVKQNTLDDTSFDSMDTADTEYSSDTSRLEQTTSFESTTDNTDSTSESQVHRLQQLRADSGYRSLENPCIKQRITNLGESSDMEVLVKKHRIPSVGDSVEENSEPEHPPTSWKDKLNSAHTNHSAQLSHRSKEFMNRVNSFRQNASHSESLENEQDEGIVLKANMSEWEQKRRLSDKTATRKRREFQGRNDSSRDMSVDEKSDISRDLSVDEKSEISQQELIIKKTITIDYGRDSIDEKADFLPQDFIKRKGLTSDYIRDYSVDEKSDKLFREYSRCDERPRCDEKPRRDEKLRRDEKPRCVQPAIYPKHCSETIRKQQTQHHHQRTGYTGV